MSFRCLHHLLAALVLLVMAASPLSAQEGFSVSELSDSLFQRIRGVSFPTADARVRRSDLRHVRVRYINYEGESCDGELICNRAIAADLLDIFRRLYEAHYPIASIRLIDDFGADDERSMRANNTSCFCYRAVSGSSNLSRHAVGMAVDLNPLENPCVRRRGNRLVVQPATAGKHVQRSPATAHQIHPGDLAYKLFTEHGFHWGGSWRSVKDYQHFEK